MHKKWQRGEKVQQHNQSNQEKKKTPTQR
jgi:hypothetical protein